MCKSLENVVAGMETPNKSIWKARNVPGQTTNHAKFCGDPTRSVRDIRDRKFVLP